MKIFITGATGYIGGSLAMSLHEAGHQVLGLTRSTDKGRLLIERGIEIVVGDLNNTSMLIEHARQADAVINAANSDDGNAVEAFLLALQGSGKPLLHTSGTSVIADEAGGNSLNETIFSDGEGADVALIVAPEKRARREIDLSVLAARGMRGIVLCNSLVYGEGRLPNSRSVQIPLLVDQALESGVVRIVGQGLNRWSTVHIDDVCELYRLALEGAPAGAFYFVENGESSFADIGHAIAERLCLKGPECWTEAEAEAVWGRARARYSLGSNSRVRAARARQELGWIPRHSSAVDWIRKQLPTRT